MLNFSTLNTTKIILTTLLSDRALSLFCIVFTFVLILPQQFLFPTSYLWCISLFTILYLCVLIFYPPKLGYLKITVLLLGCLSLFIWLQLNINQALLRAKTVASLPSSHTTILKIEKVLHQGEYQTVIASAKLNNQQTYRLYLNWQPKTIVLAGQQWQATLRLRPINSRLNFGGFDRQTWLYANHLDGRGSVKSANLLHTPQQWRDRLLYKAIQATDTLSQQGLLLALGFGEKFRLSPQQLKNFQQTGTAHLIAISGLHIGLAFLFGLSGGRCFQLLLPTAKITPLFPHCCGLLLALCYSFLAGFAIPTQRAIIAISLILCLGLSRYHWTHWQILLRVVVILLLFDPLTLLSDSFWLSVLAVTVILFWNQLFPLSSLLWRNTPLTQSQNKFSWLIKWLVALIHLQLGLTILFLPIQLFFFQGIAWSSLLVNLWLVPLFSLVLVPLILLSILSFNLIPWKFANAVADFAVQHLQSQQKWQPISQLEQLQITLFVVIFLLFLFLLLYLIQVSPPKSPELKYRLTLSPSPLFSINRSRLLSSKVLLHLLLADLFCITILGGYYYHLTSTQTDNTKWRVEMLDVGQGLAMLIVKNQRTLIFDSGSSWKNGSMAELEILPYLQRQGLTPETLILSHDDNDHSGGAKALFKAFPMLHLISPSLTSYGEKQHQYCHSGKKLSWQGLTLTFLFPFNSIPVKKAKNPHSCVVLLQDKNYSVLLTGDIEQAQEFALLPQLTQVDVLQIAHHGSKSSSSLAFLQRTQPKIALIPAGRFNQWHFPHSEVTERLQKLNIQYYNSGIVGQVRIIFSSDNIAIHTARSRFSAWYKQLVTPD
ncbi:DNA internalization-related competence protein ComEC/Rec2 [Mergibacter septicus]|uniref:DNA internalization-related competence protein ComEC/Rec2 n=1 Tax=Mergibacter septicus TaxID=221402 RepID=UPI001C76C7BA|nr:DNA internalization-related competence protein ComEC/Rec2 [Mergibacter septicus]QDJ12555.1 DNA internalization-related competence protein ComEC/Rec2 [Mergibacter septicus]